MVKTHVIYLAILCAQTMMLCSCKNNALSAFHTKIKIHGKVANTFGNSPVIIRGIGKSILTVDAQGSFSKDTILKNPTIATLEYGQMTFPIFIAPGEDVQIIMDTRQNRSGIVTIKPYTIENKFLLDFEEFKRSLEPQDYKAFFATDEKTFLASVEKRNQEINQFQQDFQKKNGTFSYDFAQAFQSEVDHDAANLRLVYPEYYKYYNPHSTLTLSENYESFFQNLKIDVEKNLSLPNYREFIGMYLTYQTQKDTSHSMTLTQKYFDQISTHFQSTAVKSYLYHKILIDAIDYRVDEVTPLLAKYKSIESNDQKIKEVETAYLEWNHLLRGLEAPDFTYEDINGKSVSLSGLKGKVVYIDVWATWCGPCLAELPALEKLQSTFAQNKHMVFVSVSIDKNKDAWRKMVSDKKLKGIQLLANGDWNSQIVNDYLIKGIPRFIIIGKDGKILNANSLRPSNSQLVKLLSEACQA
jgi:thiol-disulfide isomerase/thioredoxin